MKPIADRVIIKPAPAEEKTKGGIIIPDTAKEKPQEGKVISVGPGVKDKDGNTIPMEIEVGSVVMYKKWGGTEIKINGEEHILVKQEDILAVIEE